MLHIGRSKFITKNYARSKETTNYIPEVILCSLIDSVNKTLCNALCS